MLNLAYQLPSKAISKKINNKLKEKNRIKNIDIFVEFDYRDNDSSNKE